MRVRTKICGITRREDADVVIQAGADAIGLVFYEPSPRNVTIQQAKQIITGLAPFVTKVALFVNADVETIQLCIDSLAIDIIQFHGDESAAFCEQFKLPYIKAIRMKADIDLPATAKQYASASALLLDTYQADMPGGTGKVFDWSLVGDIDKPIILAGGLNENNVKRAIQQVSPYAIDVSGGVESSKGIKSHDKVRMFMREVINA